jgi:hypothetical protein
MCLGSGRVKALHTALMKVTPAVNFINVLRAHFLYKSLFKSQNVTRKRLSYEKGVHKTLMKLTRVHAKDACKSLVKLSLGFRKDQNIILLYALCDNLIINVI